MINTNKFFTAILLTLVINGCIKEEPVKETPFSTIGITDVTQNTAKTGGIPPSDINFEVVSRGVCWDTISSPIISAKALYVTSKVGTFIVKITNLNAETKYYSRAFMITEKDTIYANEVSFTTTSNSLVKSPCTPAINSADYKSQKHTYYSTRYYHNGLNYEINGDATYSNLSFEFMEEPSTGKYINNNSATFLREGECHISGQFPGGIGSEHYVSNGKDTIYVIQTGEGKYSVNFCNVSFITSNPGGFTSSGNLTIK